MYTGSFHADTAVQPDACSEATWWDGLLSDSRAIVVQLVAEAPLPVSDLRSRVEQHAQRLAASPSVDRCLLEPLLVGLESLLELAESRPAFLPMAHVVVRYFETDLEDDLANAFGIDDDVEVFNAAALAAGLHHLLVA